MESLVGRTLGKYQLTAMIGGGGMATVYKGRHPGLDQEVAVKILHPFLSGDPSFVDRFRREARAVAALRHPNIVRVLDSDNDDHLYYMVMEYISGPTLSAVLTSRKAAGGLSLPEVKRIITPLCDAVDYATSRGMLHRDIKPANILMSEEGEPILTDYGIAKIIGSTSLTSPGSVIGSAHYMSPEQAQGHECDIRSDLYSLGVVLFECLAGVVPYDGDTTVTVLVKHISAPIPSVRALRPNLPPAVEGVLSRALAKQPQDRYELGVSFADGLAVALTSTRTTTVVPGAILGAALSETTVEAAPSTEAPSPAPPASETPPAAPPVAEPTPAVPVSEPPQTAPVSEPEPAEPPPPPPPPPPTVIESRPQGMPPTPAQTASLGGVPLGATFVEAPPPVEPAPTPPVEPWEASPPSPPPPMATRAEAITPAPEASPYAVIPATAGRFEGAPPRGGNRKRLIVIVAVAVVLVAAIAAGVVLALRGGDADETSVSTTVTTAQPTTTSTSAPTTSTTLQSTTTTTQATTTTAKPTTTSVQTTTTTTQPTTITTAAPTTTVKKTTTTKPPATTQPTSPPGTIGPGTTTPPPTIGPG